MRWGNLATTGKSDRTALLGLLCSERAEAISIRRLRPQRRSADSGPLTPAHVSLAVGWRGNASRGAAETEASYRHKNDHEHLRGRDHESGE